MPVFELEGPNGSTYEVDAPDQGQAIAAFKKLTGGAEAPQAAPEQSALGRAYDIATDPAKSVATGIVKGAAGLAGLPRLGIDAAEAGMGWAINKAAGAVGLETNSMRGADTSSGIGKGFPQAETLLSGVEKALPLHKPKTVAGEYAQTAGEFLPAMLNPGNTAANLAQAGGKLAPEAMKRLGLEFGTQVALPAAVTETAGQVTKGTAAEPWARGAAGLASGVGSGLAFGPAYYERMAANATRKVTPEQFDAAQALKAEFPWLTNAEALQQATGGATQMGRVQRLAESLPGGEAVLGPQMAARPGQMQAATDGALDAIAPANLRPTQLGAEVQAAGRGAVLDTPEGLALRGALRDAGPTTTAGQAGQVIQPALRGRQDGLETVRKLQADRDYGTARRDTPEEFGQERTIPVEREGEPIVTVTRPEVGPRFEKDAPEPYTPVAAAAGEDGGTRESLARFIAKNGGIRTTDDLRAADLDKWTIPGVGKVVRDEGLPLDSHWRVSLRENRYFRDDADGYATSDITNELIRKLKNERTSPRFASYPIDADLNATGRAGRNAMRDDEANALSQAEGSLRSSLDNAGIGSDKVETEVFERALGAMMRDPRLDPLDAYETVVGRMRLQPEPFVKTTPTTVTEMVPDVRWGQINSEPVLAALDDQLRVAKGDAAGALQTTRKDLFARGVRHPVTGEPELDLSVEGLLKARERLDMRLRQAEKDGDGTLIRDLQTVRASLDGQLKQAPLVARADANFAANSEPLLPFEKGRLGPVTARDDLTGQMRMPVEEVPPALATPQAMRELNAQPGPALDRARSAMDGYLTTRELRAASGNMHGPDPYFVNAGKLRRGMADQADLMEEAPRTRDRLSQVLAAREGLAPVEMRPTGRVAATSETKDQLAILMGNGAAPAETREAVGALAQQNKGATRSLVRLKGDELADSTVRKLDNKARPDQDGGAHLARKYFSPGEGTSFRAALEAAAGGPVSDRVSRVMEALQATGWREGIGSRTAFNAQDMKDMQRGLIGNLVQGVTKPMSQAHETATRWMLGHQSEKLAELLSSPEGLARIRALGDRPTREQLLLLLSAQGAQSGQREPIPAHR